jgi:protein-disulfide isomerase
MLANRGLCLGLVVLSSWLGQSVRADDLSALKGEVQQLQQELRAVQQDLQEIKQFLSGRRQQPAWEHVDNAVLALEDAPQRGDARAPLVLVEFSDYQCPYCAVHAREVFPKLESEFIASGKLRYAVSEFPLVQIHPLAAKAAEAARCAGDQQHFWEMHTLLFDNQRELEPWDAHAKALHLNLPEFDSCMQEGKYAELVQNNAQVARQGGIQATPTFLLAFAEGGDRIRVVRRLRGSAPLPVFKAEIEALLAESAAQSGAR